ncbi:hypothetical protein [Thermococcus pacificus]|uniref:Uncharacterized protein n=1 Tax=Thermococcus pacificus TaxID=71998 RepID=A0A218P9M8_9EURY|nr:hypothetical protein [Thermococcus pacificus]ASJ07487.1 hypothetical protein A3L08_09240 [Thermococcus pacificus]
MIRDFSPSLLPHTLRYVRFNLGASSFKLTGKNGRSRFIVAVENNIVRGVEYESESESLITEVDKNVLEVGEDEFGG